MVEGLPDVSLHRYRAHGLTVASDYSLAMPPAPDDGGEPDLVVRRGAERPVPLADEPGAEVLALAETPDGQVFYSLTRTPAGVRMRYPGICLIRGDGTLSDVTVDVAPGLDQALIPVLVAGSVVSLHLVLRGAVVLHASAVEVDGAAVAFTGMAGMGKSTVATLFGRAGFPLVTDDVLRVTHTPPSAPVAHRGGLESRLRERASSLADGMPVRTTADGRAAVHLPLSARPELPLRVCVVPRPSRAAEAVSVRRLSEAEALVTLLRFPRLVGWSEGPTLARQFTQLGDLASAVPVVMAELPWGPPFPPGIVEQLLSALDL